MYPPHQESIVLIRYLSIDLFCCFSNLTPIHIIKSKQFSTEMNKITTSRDCGFSIILVLHESVIFKWFSESNILFQVWKGTLFLVVMWVSPHHFFLSPHKANSKFPFWQPEFQFLPSTYHVSSTQAVSLADKGQSSPVLEQCLPSIRSSSVLSPFHAFVFFFTLDVTHPFQNA